jgi:hypothetical protein
MGAMRAGAEWARGGAIQITLGIFIKRGNSESNRNINLDSQFWLEWKQKNPEVETYE